MIRGNQVVSPCGTGTWCDVVRATTMKTTNAPTKYVILAECSNFLIQHMFPISFPTRSIFFLQLRMKWTIHFRLAYSISTDDRRPTCLRCLCVFFGRIESSANANNFIISYWTFVVQSYRIKWLAKISFCFSMLCYNSLEYEVGQCEREWMMLINPSELTNAYVAVHCPIAMPLRMV